MLTTELKSFGAEKKIYDENLKFEILERGSPYFSIVEKAFKNYAKLYNFDEKNELKRIITCKNITCEFLSCKERVVGLLIYNNEINENYKSEEISETFEVKRIIILKENDVNFTSYANKILERILELNTSKITKNICIIIPKNDEKVKEFLIFNNFKFLKFVDNAENSKFQESIFHIKLSKKLTIDISNKEKLIIEKEKIKSTKKRKSDKNTKDAIKVKKSNKKSKSNKRKDLHNLTLKKIFIQQIRRGEKTVEGRVSKGAVLKYRKGDKVRFYYYSNASDDVTCQIVNIRRYKTFREMLVNSGFKNCIPEAASLEDAVKAYDQIPNYSANAAKFGVTAIHLSVLAKTDLCDS